MVDYPVKEGQVWDVEHARLKKPLERILYQGVEPSNERMDELVSEVRRALRCCSSPSPNGACLCIRKEGHSGVHEWYHAPGGLRETWD